jgi:hypothetical protein
MAEGAGTRTHDVLDLVRVLLLLQAAIMVASAVEALVFALAFGTPVGAVLSGLAAVALFVSRGRLAQGRPGPRRVVYAIEALVLSTLAVDVALGLFLAHTTPPALAVLTRLVLPASIIATLRRSTVAATAPEALSELAA